MIEFLQQINPLFSILAFVIAIVGIALTIVFYLKSNRVRKPRYYIKSHNLVTDFSSKLANLKMLYGDTRIENLTVSKIAFWNDGVETIQDVNIVGDDPLRIQAIGSCDILDANVIEEIDEVNKFRVETVDNKTVKILFAFLEKGQGGAIQVIHTGKDSSDIKVEGRVIGAGKPLPSYTRSRLFLVLDKIFSPSKQPQPPKPQPAKVRRILSIILFFSAFFMLIMVFGSRAIPERIFSIVTFLLYAYFGYTMLRRRVPKGLEIVEEEEIN